MSHILAMPNYMYKMIYEYLEKCQNEIKDKKYQNGESSEVGNVLGN